MLRFLLFLLLGSQVFAQNFNCSNLPAYFPGPVEFCGYDGITHVTRTPASVFFACNITVNYPGPCGCPNFCNQDLNQGTCQSGNCVCSPGWKGPDCSLVDCAENNTCNNRGVCQNKYGIDFCICQSGWTGAFCDTPVQPVDLLPYGQIMGPPYWDNGDDKYEDDHPIFNKSVIATIHIHMPAATLKTLRSTWGAENGTYLKADMVFTNGNIWMEVPDIGIKVKGFSSRQYAKKSWKIKFNEFEKGREFYGVKKMGLKANSQDITAQRSLHSTEILRAVGVPSARSGYANVFVNDINFGLFWVEEIIDKDFLKSRFSSDKGNFYKGFGGMLHYLGPLGEPYKNYPPFGFPSVFPGKRAYDLKYTDGDESYQDLANLATAANSTNNWKQNVSSYLEADDFTRAMIVSTSTTNIDCFSIDGNNYQLWRPKKSNRFTFMPTDFDLSFFTIPVTFTSNNNNYTLADVPPSTWGSLWPNDFLPIQVDELPNPITARFLTEYQTEFDSYYQIYLEKLWNTESPLVPRIRSYLQFLNNTMTRDHWFALDVYANAAMVVQSVEQSVIPQLQERMFFLTKIIGTKK